MTLLRSDGSQPAQGFLGWRMVAIVFLAQNMAYGLSYGVYGTLLLPLSGSFGTPRALAALGLAAVMLTNGLLAPLMAYAVGRWSIRAIMSCGVALMSVGYLLVALAPSMPLLLLAFGLLVGLGVTMLGHLTSNTLITRWFFTKRGTALGIAVMPVFITIMPMVATALTMRHGWRVTAAVMGFLVLLLLPVLRFVIDRPALVGQSPLGWTSSAPAAESASSDAVGLSAAALLSDWRWWLICLASGLAVSGSSMLVTHLIPMANDAGVPQGQAALLLSALGASGILGALLFGTIGDRIGFANALMLNVGLQALLWSGLLTTHEFPTYLGLAIGIGLCSGGQSPANAALLSRVFGQVSYAKAAGFSGLLTVPLLFAAPPFAGLLFDRTGSYRMAVMIHMGAFVLSALAYFTVGRSARSLLSPVR